MTIRHITEYYTQILRNKYSFHQHMRQFRKLITYYDKKQVTILVKMHSMSKN